MKTNWRQTAPRTQHEYKLLIEVATSRIEAARTALKETKESA